MHDYPTEYYPAPLARIPSKVVERYAWSHDHGALLLFFTDQTYVSLGAEEIDGQVVVLSKLSILMRFGDKHLCSLHLTDDVMLEAWRNARKQKAEEAARLARFTMYKTLREEFGDNDGKDLRNE